MRLLLTLTRALQFGLTAPVYGTLPTRNMGRVRAVARLPWLPCASSGGGGALPQLEVKEAIRTAIAERALDVLSEVRFVRTPS